MVLLDTNILIDVLRRRNDRPAQVEKLLIDGFTLATSAVNIAEVYSGLRLGEEAKTGAVIDSLQCYPVTATIAKHAGLLRTEAKRRGRTFALPDMLVASTVLEYGLSLMTENRKDFPFPAINFLPSGWAMFQTLPRILGSIAQLSSQRRLAGSPARVLRER